MLTALVDAINAVSGWIIGHIAMLFAGLNPWIGLTVLSGIAGVLLVFLYGLLSPQARMKEIKRRIMADLFESVIFRHRLGIALKAQGRMLLGGLWYFVVVLPALIALFIPCVVILAQLNLYYGVRGVNSQEAVLVKVDLADARLLKADLKLESSEAVNIDGPVRIAKDSEVVWRVAGVTGPTALKLTADGSNLDIKIAPNTDGSKKVAVRTSSALESLLYPAGPVLRNSAFKEVAITYPDKRYELGTMSFHWMVVFLVISLVSGFIGSKIFKITL